MYVYHKDIPNKQWNVFEVVDGHEIFDCPFQELEEARAYCQRKNDEMYRTGSPRRFSVMAREEGE